jgi:NADPH:quinone reductase-like Zn-dependent oxidoreductase
VLVDVEDPVPGPGQVRIVMRAAGVNPIECKIRRGMMAQRRPMTLPAGLGTDIAGVVDQVGDGVTEFAVGDELMGSSQTPAYAELALAQPSDLTRRPARVPWEVAGAVGIAGRTAWRILAEARVGSGDTVLVHAAAGGVGLVAVQLAVARGARVIGTAGDANHDFLRSLGAIPIRYGDGWEQRVRAVSPTGVDAVLDLSGRGELPGSIELAGGTERIVTVAAYDAADHGVYFSGPGSTVDTSPALGELAAQLEAGTLVLQVWKTYPLSQAAAAHAESEAAHLRGKIVLVPG